MFDDVLYSGYKKKDNHKTDTSYFKKIILVGSHYRDF